jgi:hypothetical protein
MRHTCVLCDTCRIRHANQMAGNRTWEFNFTLYSEALLKYVEHPCFWLKPDTSYEPTLGVPERATCWTFVGVENVSDRSYAETYVCLAGTERLREARKEPPTVRCPSTPLSTGSGNCRRGSSSSTEENKKPQSSHSSVQLPSIRALSKWRYIHPAQDVRFN